MAYIPFYAAMAFVIFRKYKKFNFTELLVIFLYAQAHLSIITAFLTPAVALAGNLAIGIVGSIILPAQMVYFAYVLKRVYGLTLSQILVRTLLFLLLLFFFMILFSIAMGIYMYQTGMFEQMKQGP
jgi:hypothetical protein